MFNLECLNCGDVFQSKVVLDNFCSENCQNQHFSKPKNERIITITTECTKCHQDYTRPIYLEECRNFQGLALCHECSGLNMIRMVNFKNSTK